MIWPRFPLRLPMMVTGFPNLTPEKHRIHVCFRDSVILLATAGRSIHVCFRDSVILLATAGRSIHDSLRVGAYGRVTAVTHQGAD
jgi:hypothetical protein